MAHDRMSAAGHENIAGSFLQASGRVPGAPALRLGTQAITHGELDASVAAAASLLFEHGVQAGDRVGLILPNVSQFTILYYAVLQAGAIAVPISTLLSSREAKFCLEDAEASLAFVWAEGGQHPPVASGTETIAVEAESYHFPCTHEPQVAPRDGEDTAVIIYTSGTTGRPKGAQLTHRNLARNAAAIIDATGIDAATVALGALPLSHSFGQTWLLNATLGAGGCVSLLERFSPGAAADAIGEHRVTFFAGVPTMFSQLLEAPPGPADTALELCVSGGAPMPAPLMHAFEARFHCEVREGYGLSETSPLVTLNPPGRNRRPGSVGTAIPGVELKILDDQGQSAAAGELGEILVSGHNVMKGYWNRPHETGEALTADGWFRTGDLGYLDADGYLSIAGRKKDLIIRGGYNVYPREVEDVLLAHPAVAEAAVIGIPHPTLGEEVAAAVRLHADAVCELGELLAHAKQHLASYKYPRRLWTVERLPTGATGKILKRLIAIPAMPARQNHGAAPDHPVSEPSRTPTTALRGEPWAHTP
ncbi:MAG: fatty-acid-CoA ligase [Solirubrobacterales bacterium]|nr:fatty-acid-CoA ligase [Solirubrobacterales bacterium]